MFILVCYPKVDQNSPLTACIVVSDDDEEAEVEAYIRAQAEVQLKTTKVIPINNEVFPSSLTVVLVVLLFHLYNTEFLFV